MGAANFHSEGKGASAAEVFDQLVEQAAWDHGHGGYTGTIAEKTGFVTYPLPADITADMLDGALSSFHWIEEDRVGDPVPWAKGAVEDFDKCVAAYGRDQLERMADVYDDKWGPALCVQTGPDTWAFMGYASE
jgi:hypothetical protein